MDNKKLIEIYKNWFGKLKPKEQRLFIAFLVVLFFSFYLKASLLPTFNKISSLKKQSQEIKSKKELLVAQFPNIENSRLELETIKLNIQDVKFKADEIESMMLSPAQVSELLAELVKAAQGMQIDFQTVKQKIEIDKDGFSHLYIDMKFESNYEDAVNYIKRIEEISAYTKVEGVDLAQSKNDALNLINISLKLSAILGLSPSPQNKFMAQSGQAGAKLNISRSPLMPRFNIGQSKKKLLKLTGITFRNRKESSSAIINDTVVKIGEEIAGQKVEDILFDSVVINDGVESKTLRVER